MNSVGKILGLIVTSMFVSVRLFVQLVVMLSCHPGSFVVG
jgi:hypothetical protein